MAILHMRSEEAEARLDPVLATPVGRFRWATSYVLLAAVGTAVVLAALSLPVGLAYCMNAGRRNFYTATANGGGISRPPLPL